MGPVDWGLVWVVRRCSPRPTPEPRSPRSPAGPGPSDVAIAYERAWNDLDFNLLYDLSGAELRDGLRRDQFVATKRAAYANADKNARIGARIGVETSVA